MTETLIDFTDSAASKVSALIQEDGNLNLKLRIYVSGGGCSGFEYNFAFDEVVNEDDTVIEKNAVSLFGRNPDEAVRILTHQVDSLAMEPILRLRRLPVP